MKTHNQLRLYNSNRNSNSNSNSNNIILTTLLVVSWLLPTLTNAFTVINYSKMNRRLWTQSTSFCRTYYKSGCYLYSSTDDNCDNYNDDKTITNSTTNTGSTASSSNQDKSNHGRYTEERPELVDQSIFLSSIEIIQKAIATENGMEYVSPNNNNDPNIAFAIGRVMATIQIPPGIDLIETPQLVLINGVNQAAKDAGIAPLDSIVQIYVGKDRDFVVKTKGLNMDDTVSAMKAAMAYAREHKCTEIELELNRLLKGYYK